MGTAVRLRSGCWDAILDACLCREGRGRPPGGVGESFEVKYKPESSYPSLAVRWPILVELSTHRSFHVFGEVGIPTCVGMSKNMILVGNFCMADGDTAIVHHGCTMLGMAGEPASNCNLLYDPGTLRRVIYLWIPELDLTGWFLSKEVKKDTFSTNEERQLTRKRSVRGRSLYIHRGIDACVFNSFPS